MFSFFSFIVLAMRPSGVAINPPVSVVWKGSTVMVSCATRALKELKLPIEEVDEFLGLVYLQNPQLVSDIGSLAEVRVHFGDVVQYLKSLKSRWIDSPIPLVDKETAFSRAKICEVCPEKKKLSGCYGCSGLSSLLMHIPEFLFGTDQACGVCKCYLNNKVWMGDEVIATDDRQLKYPSNCWVNEIVPPQLPEDLI